MYLKLKIYFAKFKQSSIKIDLNIIFLIYFVNILMCLGFLYRGVYKIIKKEVAYYGCYSVDT